MVINRFATCVTGVGNLLTKSPDPPCRRRSAGQLEPRKDYLLISKRYVGSDTLNP